MTTVEVKIFLLLNGLTLQEMARELADDGQNITALRVMLSQMVNGARWYPTLAEKVKERYGLRLQRPAQERRYFKQAA